MVRRLFSFVLLAALLVVPVLATEVDCDRPMTDDIYEYKETYVPVEFTPEPFGMEVVDLALIAVAMGVAAWFSLRRKPAKWLTALMAAGLLYFGLYRGGCVCPVGATTNFVMGLAAPELVGRIVAALFLLPLLFAFLFGRVFCASACPLGAIQHLLARKRPVRLPRLLNAASRWLPAAVLAVTIWGALRGAMFIACKLDVYKVVFFTGYAWIDQIIDAVKGALAEPRILLIGDWVAWTTLALVLALGWFVPRPFCRFACPYGVLLGALARLGFRRRRIDPDTCVHCGQCEKACPVQAIHTPANAPAPAVDNFHCVQCGRCDDACKRSCPKG